MFRSLARRLKHRLYTPPPPPPPPPEPPPEPFDWAAETDLSYERFVALGRLPEQFQTHRIPIVPRTLFFDIADLMIFISAHGFLSPLQQGQADLLEASLGGAGVSSDFEAVEFCYSEFLRPWRLAPDLLAELLAYIRSGDIDVGKASGIVERIRAGGRAFLPGHGSVYFAPGAFWAGCVALGLCGEVQLNGGRFGVMVHDLSALAGEAEQMLRRGVAEWDFFSTPSPRVAADLKAFARGAAPDRAIVIEPMPWPGRHARTAEDIAWEARSPLSHQSFLDGGKRDADLADPAIPVVGDILVYDLSDLMIFLSTHGFVSGIQRVQLELLGAVLGRPQAATRFTAIEFAVSDFDRPWRLPTHLLQDLLHYAKSGQVDLARARAAVDRLRGAGRAFIPGEGAIYCSPGAFWAGCIAKGLCTTVQRGGARFGVVIYDIFPITLPHMAEPNTAKTFEGLLQKGIAQWDFFVADSRYTAGELAAYIRRTAPQRRLPVLPVPLAQANTAAQDAGALPAGLAAGRYILCVATIEPRKNHAVLIAAWRALRARRPDSPDLVLVGRAGWRSEALVESLRADREAGGGIHWLDSVSDAELAALYRDCLFTVYPSLAEGWGLPVGGGRFADYVDPLSVRAITCALETYSFNAKRRLRRERAIARSFRPRTWGDFADQLTQALSDPERAARDRGLLARFRAWLS